VRRRIQEEISRRTIFISTEGERVAQVNGLSVLDVGELRFGQPNRITATASVGRGNVVAIEREVKLSGPFHSKGVLILSSFLAARYARDRPLSLTASLVFEQNYGPIDGDSASLAETCALLSVLAEIPIRQSFAMTGSINQHGEVQPIGGVNEKIEGFYDVCRDRGLTGDQGVIVPDANVKHLMLRRDVVEAVAAGRFAVHAVRTVDEAVELLTGVAVGERDDAGRFPDDTLNGRVQQRLEALYKKRRELAAGAAATISDVVSHVPGGEDAPPQTPPEPGPPGDRRRT
jgi:predicted ATP-dependent protease